MLSKIASFFLISALVFHFGCASIVSKTDYPVIFTSSPDGANISIVNKYNQEIYKGTTPTTVTLKSSTGFFSGARYSIKCEKDGYEATNVMLEKELNGWYIGNILFGGLIGLLIVDPATGAMWKLPTNSHCNLSAKAVSLGSGSDETKIVFLEDIPESLRSQLIPIK